VALISTQSLDATCAAVAQAGLAVQLAAVLWRLLGSLLAVEQMVFLVFEPLWLARLHAWLAGVVVGISGALHRVGASGRVLDSGARCALPQSGPLHSAHKLLQRHSLFLPRCSRGAHPTATGCAAGRGAWPEDLG
jgi:hypothetical protein